MAGENTEISIFTERANQYRKEFIRQGDVEARFIPLLLLAIALGTGIFHSGYLMLNGQITAGDVVAYFGLLLMLQFPTFVSLFAYSQISLGIAGAKRILQLIAEETQLDQNESGLVKEIDGYVRFENASYSYEGDTLTLDNITLEVSPGQTVAIVGQTGAGKTTLVKLINRIYDTEDGKVMIDGVDVKEWNLESLRSQISIIEQDIFLFSRSIRENIGFGKQKVSEEEIIKAAKAAQAHDFIVGFEEGYDTVIGERGVTLSGGQRQRLALARAFMTDPKILILDDSTSAIDSKTEDQIQQAIYAAAQDRTTFIITHRLSQIRWADLILVLKNGKIDAIGTHDDLIETSKAYRNIFSE
jgi:ATP-binding cassette subfamily B protein